LIKHGKVVKQATATARGGDMICLSGDMANGTTTVAR
jgi:tRNA A37 threonylcarbamoyladenosine biosynthesis protein TsaE